MYIAEYQLEKNAGPCSQKHDAVTQLKFRLPHAKCSKKLRGHNIYYSYFV